jgi:hypothetical protein
MLRRRRSKIIVGCAVAILIYGAWPGCSTFTISRETTYVTEPIDSDGYVDYVSALNQQLSRGVTPENNANVLIWQALGPHPEKGHDVQPGYFDRLGIKEPPENGHYLSSFQDYLARQGKLNHGNDYDVIAEFSRQMDEAQGRPWTAKEFPLLAGWFDECESSFAALIEGVSRTEYFNPLLPKRSAASSAGLFGTELPNVQKHRLLATALLCRAMLRTGEGKYLEAWKYLIASHRLGRLTARGATVIESLVGIAIEYKTQNTDVAFLANAKLSSGQLLALMNEWKSLPALPNAAEKIDRYERIVLLDLVLHAAKYGLSYFDEIDKQSEPPMPRGLGSRLFSLSVNWDPALRIFNEWLDRAAAAARIEDRSARSAEFDRIRSGLQNLKAQSQTLQSSIKFWSGPTRRGEAIGNVMISLLLPAYDKIRGAEDRDEQGQRNLLVAFAMARYRADTSGYPDRLSELVPNYIAEIPDDLFSGGPLIYRREKNGYLLYSVGPNGVDDGGRSATDEPRGDDIVVRMGFTGDHTNK